MSSAVSDKTTNDVRKDESSYIFSAKCDFARWVSTNSKTIPRLAPLITFRGVTQAVPCGCLDFLLMMLFAQSTPWRLMRWYERAVHFDSSRTIVFWGMMDLVLHPESTCTARQIFPNHFAELLSFTYDSLSPCRVDSFRILIVARKLDAVGTIVYWILKSQIVSHKPCELGWCTEWSK